MDDLSASATPPRSGRAMPRLTSAQIRGARGMLAWSMSDLAAAARISVSTVKRMETAGPQPVSDDAFLFARTALERAGVIFLPDDGQGVGIRLRTANP